MLRLLIGSLLCIFLANCLSANAASIERSEEAVAGNNSSLAHDRQKRYLYGYDYYGYSYYNWYSVYQSYFQVSTCGSVSICPVQCPGTCGLYAGLSACRCNSCPYIGDVCSGIARGIYLYPFALDTTRYIQCDRTPGVFFIRSCPSGYIWDSVYSVCNYPYHGYSAGLTFLGK